MPEKKEYCKRKQDNKRNKIPKEKKFSCESA